MNETQKQLPEVFYKKKLFVKISQYLQENSYAESLSNRAADPLKRFRPATSIKRDSNTVFSLNIAKFWRTLILRNICERLLLENLQRLYDLITKPITASLLRV